MVQHVIALIVNYLPFSHVIFGYSYIVITVLLALAWSLQYSSYCCLFCGQQSCYCSKFIPGQWNQNKC